MTLCPIRYFLLSTVLAIRHYVSFGIYYFQHFYHSTFCPNGHFLLSTLFLLGVLSHSMFCPFEVFTIRHFVIQHFVQFDVLSFNVFYGRRFLLWHFVSEPIGQCESLSYLWPLIRQEHYFLKQNTNEILLIFLWFNLFGWLAGRWPSFCRCMAAAWGTPPPRPPNGTTDREG
jgi:hypothetical protein